MGDGLSDTCRIVKDAKFRPEESKSECLCIIKVNRKCELAGDF